MALVGEASEDFSKDSRCSIIGFSVDASVRIFGLLVRLSLSRGKDGPATPEFDAMEQRSAGNGVQAATCFFVFAIPAHKSLHPKSSCRPTTPKIVGFRKGTLIKAQVSILNQVPTLEGFPGLFLTTHITIS